MLRTQAFGIDLYIIYSRVLMVYTFTINKDLGYG